MGALAHRPRPGAGARARAEAPLLGRPSPRVADPGPGLRHDRRAVVDVTGRCDKGSDTRLDGPHDPRRRALRSAMRASTPIACANLRRRLGRRSIHEDVAALAQSRARRAGLHEAHRAQPAIDARLVDRVGSSAFQHRTGSLGGNVAGRRHEAGPAGPPRSDCYSLAGAHGSGGLDSRAYAGGSLVGLVGLADLVVPVALSAVGAWEPWQQPEPWKASPNGAVAHCPRAAYGPWTQQTPCGRLRPSGFVDLDVAPESVCTPES